MSTLLHDLRDALVQPLFPRVNYAGRLDALYRGDNGRGFLRIAQDRRAAGRFRYRRGTASATETLARIVSVDSKKRLRPGWTDNDKLAGRPCY